MPRGRSAELQRLYDLQEGESLALHPGPTDSVDRLVKKLKQVATLYLREGKAYRLEPQANHVLATRVPVGSHKKLSYLTDLKVGERWFAGAVLDWTEKKALLARLDRMNVSGRGQWYAEVDADGIYVRRWYRPAERVYWNDDRAFPEPVPLTLSRD